MDDAKAEVLAFAAFPREHWRKIWSTNPLERLNKEIKRRSRVVGIFPNEAAVIRLIGAVLADTHDEWATDERRVSRDGFGRLTQYTIQAVDLGVHVSTSWEPGLGRLSTYRVDRDNVATPDQDATFGYDPSGRVTSIADTPDPATPARTDRQCFQYTWAGELTEAWANADATCTATPALKATGAAPYWTSWTYDAHRRATQTQHGATADTTTAYTYPALGAVPGAGGAGGFHAVASTSRTVGTGSPATAAFGYDTTGNTTSTPLPAGGTGTIGYDELGKTKTVTAAGATGSTRYVYDAEGGLLVRRDPSGAKTLYLGDTEVTYTPAAGATPAATTAIRLFTFDGQVVAIRTGPAPPVWWRSRRGTRARR